MTILKRILVVVLSLVITLTASLAVYSIKEEAAEPMIFPVAAAVGDEAAAEGTTYTAVPSKVAKTETVYVNLDTAGGVSGITVSDKITTDKAECAVADISTMTDITTVSSNALQLGVGKNLVWHMGSDQLIYNGTSNKKLPVSIDIDYTLNGTSVSAQDIKGQQGTVAVNISLTNNEIRQKTINGTTHNVYSPFIVIGGMVLTGGNYSSVAVDNGKVISDSSKDIVLMIGFPGLNESLNLQKLGITDLSFADSFNVTMSTTDFEAGDFYFAVVPLSTIDFDFALPDSLGNAMDGISKITELQNSLSSIDINKLMDIFSSESGNNINKLLRSLSDATNLYNTNSSLIELMKKYMTDGNIAQFKDFFEALKSAKISENLSLYKSVASLLGISDLITKYEEIQPLIDELMADLDSPEVQKAIDALPQTIASIESLKKTLDENSEMLNEMGKFLSSDSFRSLLNLMESYNENKNLFSSLTSTAGSLQDLVPYLEMWFDLADDYSIYTEAAANMDTSVMFIYKTSAL